MTPHKTVAEPSVVLVDDRTLFRRGVAVAIEQAGIVVLGEASNGRIGVELVTRLQPDVIVMDLHMPLMDGVEATRAITALHPAAQVLMFTVSEDEDDVLDALAAGACGYILKDAAPQDVAAAIRAAAARETPLSPRVAARLVDRVRAQDRSGQGNGSNGPALTDRELDILRLIVDGKENAEIASELMISPSTAKNHVASVLQKLGVQNRVQAAVHAVRAGLI